MRNKDALFGDFSQDALFGDFSRGPTVGEIWDKQDRERKADEAQRIEDARADAKAVWLLADYYLPPDVKEMAERFKMTEALQEIWRGAFIQGWRAANRGR